MIISLSTNKEERSPKTLHEIKNLKINNYGPTPLLTHPPSYHGTAQHWTLKLNQRKKREILPLSWATIPGMDR